jgi:hypothetical protein
MQARLDSGTVRRLIRRELGKSEIEGIALSRELEAEALGSEECERRLKAVRGYRVWWSADSGVELGETRIINLRPLAGGERYEVLASCRLAIARAQEYAPGQAPEENTASVRMVVNVALEVVEFDFRWGEYGDGEG